MNCELFKTLTRAKLSIAMLTLLTLLTCQLLRTCYFGEVRQEERVEVTKNPSTLRVNNNSAIANQICERKHPGQMGPPALVTKSKSTDSTSSFSRSCNLWLSKPFRPGFRIVSHRRTKSREKSTASGETVCNCISVDRAKCCTSNVKCEYFKSVHQVETCEMVDFRVGGRGIMDMSRSWDHLCYCTQ